MSSIEQNSITAIITKLIFFTMQNLIHSQPKFILLPSEPKYILKKAHKTKYKQDYNASFKKSNTVFIQPTKQSNKWGDKQLGEVAKELNESMQSVVGEQKKNQFLKNIIAILKIDVERAEQEQKQKQKVRNVEDIKVARKAQYDIEQILQKHNEEIFKINNLKIQVSASRSDRLVFSNLFKKIEKEIKNLQQSYYKLLIKNQKMKEACSKLEKGQVSKYSQSDSLEQLKHVAQFQEKATIAHRNLVERGGNKVMASQTFFMTICDKQKQEKRGGNEGIRRKQKDKTLFLQQMTNIQNVIESTLKRVGFSTVQESVVHYEALQESNERLIGQIEEDSNLIFQIETEIQRIKFQIDHNNVYEARQLFMLERLPSERRIRTLRTIQGQPFVNQNEEILQGIKQLLNIRQSIDQSQNCVDIYKTLDQKVEELVERKPKSVKKNHMQRQNTMTWSAEAIFSKMQKYELSDKILSRQQFAQEYLNEKSKSRKTLKLKKLHF